MKKSLLALMLVIGFSAVAQDYKPGVILVAPKPGLSQKLLESDVLKPHGLAVGRKLRNLDIYEVKVAPGQEKHFLEKLKQHKHIDFAELDQKTLPSFTPNDPGIANSYYLTNTNTFAAWDIGFGEGVTIGILDTGINANHLDLAASVVPGYNYLADTTNTVDDNGHGTSVSGAAAAINNNLRGGSGIAGKAKIMPMKIAGSDGVGYWSAVTEAITDAPNKGVRVLNISYSNIYTSSSIIYASNIFKSKGGIVVVAANNDGVETTAAPTTSMIVVSATNKSNVLASFSTWGSAVSLAAPGDMIYTTVIGGGYQYGIGTSYASPIVAGAAALVMSVNPTLSAYQVENILFSTAVDLGDPGRDKKYGYGLLNVGAAALLAKDTPINDTTAPAVALTGVTNGETIEGIKVIDVTANDASPIQSVVLKVDGQTIGTDYTAPYQFSFDSNSKYNGTYALVASATDSFGNVGTSMTYTVQINNPDTIFPVLAINSPMQGYYYNGKKPIKISSTASDNSGWVEQRLYINNVLKYTVVGTTLSYNWNASREPKGEYTVSITASDKAGNITLKSVTVGKI